MLARSTTTALVAAAMFAALAAPTSAPVEARNRGGKVAAGIIIGAAALAILANSARARPNSFAAKCHRWYEKCMDGNDWACEKFETRGCAD